MDKDKLFKHNMSELNKLELTAGSQVKSLVMECINNGPFYFKLFDAESDGNKIKFKSIEGNVIVLSKVAEALGGIKIVDDLIEVF